MAVLTPAQIAGLVHAHTNDRNLAIQAVAVALAESGGRTNARNANRNRTGIVTSTDRGLWQINDYWHHEVSDAQADDPVAATKAAARISGGFRDMHEWSTYKSIGGNPPAYKRRLPAALAGVEASWGAIAGGSSAPGALGDIVDGVTDVVTAPLDGLAQVGRFAGALGERSTWIRVVEVVGGGLLLTIGAVMLNVELVAGVGGKLLGGDKGGAATTAIAAIPGGRVATKVVKGAAAASAAKAAKSS